MVKVKICGITCVQDAIWAASLGVDFIGLNFYKGSPRKISPQMALEIVKQIPPFVSPVGIFVNEEITNIVKLAKKCGLKLVQLHGEESPEFVQQLKETIENVQIIKAFRIKDEQSLEIVPNFKDFVDYFLLDAFVEGEPGGTGNTFNWDLAVKVKELGKPIFLSGGLNPENVQEAINKVKPFAVDVASGIERLPRRKDYEKMKEFINKAKSV